jgi:hypothetical protein
MASIANIVAFDGASTPVSHTLLPVSVSREKDKVTANWREALTGVPVYAQVRVTMTLERQKSGVYRLSSRTVVPVQEVVTGSNSAGYSAAPKVAYENTIDLVGFFHERSDVAGRRLVRQLAINIAGGISTSVTPVTTGPVADLFDILNAPT